MMQNLKDEYENAVLREIRKQGKVDGERLCLPGWFFVVEYLPHACLMREGRRARWHRENRYAINRDHAIRKVKHDHPAATINEGSIRCYTYDQAIQKLTARSGTLAAVLKEVDLAELRDDLLALEAMRGVITVPKPFHPTTMKVLSEMRKGPTLNPPMSTEPTMHLKQLVAKLQQLGFKINDSQLLGVLSRDKIPVAAKPSDDGKRRYSDSDLRVIVRHLTFVRPHWKMKPSRDSGDS